MPGRELVLISRQGCELCEELEALLAPYEVADVIALRRLDVDRDPGLHALHAYRVPVLLEGGTELLWGRIEPSEVIAVLGQLPVARERGGPKG